MIILKRSGERRYSKVGAGELRETFDRDNPRDPFHGGFRTLESLNERVLAPGTHAAMESDAATEILTYVWHGTIAQEYSTGIRQELGPGEWGRSSARSGSTQRTVNGSPTDHARTFQCCFTPDRSTLKARPEKRHYSIAERRGILRLVFSPDGRNESLRLRQNARGYSSILDPGHHVVHELPEGRAAWLQVLSGRIQLIDHILCDGDGASFVEESSVSLTALELSEILLVEVT
jgi:redox-sensitive bicupin YhaK (pirin superfamily)